MSVSRARPKSHPASPTAHSPVGHGHRRRQWGRCAGLGAVIFVAIVRVQAEPITTPHVETPPVARPTHAREITVSPPQSTAEQRAALWHLDTAQWQRYETLMQGVRGAVSDPTLSPIEVLGIHARTDAERRYFAERWAQILFEDTERVLAFQREYKAAFARLYPTVRAIDRTAREALSTETALSPSSALTEDRWLVFVRTDCDVCRAPLVRALERHAEQGVDLYLTDTEASPAGDARARAWVKTLGTPLRHLFNEAITINHANDYLHQRRHDDRQTFQVFRRHGSLLTPIEAASW